MHPHDNMREQPLLIRSCHPDAFRSGQWARVIGAVMYVPITVKGDAEHRPCYHIEFVDGYRDYWPIHDPVAEYEFGRMATA